MKNIILLVFAALIMTGCVKQQRVTHRYEVLLSTKDTMYVDAWFYDYSSATFTSSTTVKFYDIHYMDFLTIDNPIYIKEIK